jgi:hypothetical protein
MIHPVNLADDNFPGRSEEPGGDEAQLLAAESNRPAHSIDACAARLSLVESRDVSEGRL